VLPPATIAGQQCLLPSEYLICSVAFAAAMSIPYILLTNFREVRAEMPLLLLLLPAALTGLRAFLAPLTQSPSISPPRSSPT